MSDPKRPIGVFLLLGPTGVGKTHTAESLAVALHGSEKKILRIDCGELFSDHEVARFIGAPPGYLGHRETQPLLSQAKVNAASSDKSEISIILLDEIEKAAPAIQRMMLGIFDNATLRLGDNSTVNFSNSIFIMTSNLGAKEALKEIRGGKLGFDVGTKDLSSTCISAAKNFFAPEFWNRIDHVSVYQPLSKEVIAKIVDGECERIVNTMIQQAYIGSLVFTSAAKKLLTEGGFSAEYGARPLKRFAHKNVVVPLSCLILELRSKSEAHRIITVGASGGKFTFEVQDGLASTVGEQDDGERVVQPLARRGSR